MNVKTTISFEVKIVRIETIKYKKIKNLKFDPLDFINTLLAHIEKKPTLSKKIEIKEIDINKIKIFTGFMTKEKSNKEINDSLEIEFVAIKINAQMKGTK